MTMSTGMSGSGPHIWAGVVLAATGLCVAAGLAFSKGAADPPAQHSVAEAAPAGGAPPELKIEVNLIAGADGGPLRAGGRGWVFLCVINQCKNHLYVPMVSMKSLLCDPPLPVPSYQDKGLRQDYAGFGISEMTLEFVDGGGKAVHQVVLGPPDGQFLLPPGTNGFRGLGRPITAPSVPGTYAVRVRLDTSEALRARSTWGGAGQGIWDPELVVKDMTHTAVKAETTVQGVRVVGIEVSGTGKG